MAHGKALTAFRAAMTSQALRASRGWWPCAAGRDRLAREDIPGCGCWGTQHPSTKGHSSSVRGGDPGRAQLWLLSLGFALCQLLPCRGLSLADVTVPSQQLSCLHWKAELDGVSWVVPWHCPLPWHPCKAPAPACSFSWGVCLRLMGSPPHPTPCLSNLPLIPQLPFLLVAGTRTGFWADAPVFDGRGRQGTVGSTGTGMGQEDKPGGAQVQGSCTALGWSCQSPVRNSPSCPTDPPFCSRAGPLCTGRPPQAGHPREL